MTRPGRTGRAGTALVLAPPMALLTALATLATAGPARAAFTTGASAALPVSSAVLLPPTGLSVTCFGSDQRVTISWTRSASAFATGYTVTGNWSGNWQSVTVPGGSTSTVSPDQTGVPAGTSVYLVASYDAWLSAPSASVTTPACP